MYDVNSVLVMNHKFYVTLVGTKPRKLQTCTLSIESEGVVEPFSTLSAAVLCLIRDNYKSLINA